MSKPIDDEWWTTDMVCAHLKLSKRALWDIRNAPAKAFPLAIKPGGKVNLFRAADVRAWMAGRTQIGVRAAKALIEAPPAQAPVIAPTPTTQPAKATVMTEPATRDPEPPSPTPAPIEASVAPAKKSRRRGKGQKEADPDQLPLF